MADAAAPQSLALKDHAKGEPERVGAGDGNMHYTCAYCDAVVKGSTRFKAHLDATTGKGVAVCSSMPAAVRQEFAADAAAKAADARRRQEQRDDERRRQERRASSVGAGTSGGISGGTSAAHTPVRAPWIAA